MTEEPTSRAFQVDLRGVVDLLGSAIYSSPRVYLRELLQNAVDAVTARQHLDPTYRTDGIAIVPASANANEFRITDDGIGLTLEEVDGFLATVGRSSKRELLDHAHDEWRGEGFLGQFGIGLLSGFMVADRITMRTRSATGGPPVEWVGSADGTYTTRVLTGAEADRPIGTEVVLLGRPDEHALLADPGAGDIATHFGKYLPVPIRITGADGTPRLITKPPAFVRNPATTQLPPGTDELGRALVGREPLASISIDVEESGTQGIAYVLPFTPTPSAARVNHVYLGRMLVSESVPELTPEWAFFVRCVVNSTGLKPTASREHLVDNAALSLTREAIGEALSGWLLGLATDQPALLARFIGLHYLALKSLVVHEAAIARTIIGLLPMDTSHGWLPIAEIVASDRVVRYVETTDQFRQVVALTSPHEVIVNCGHTFDVDILRQLPELIEGVEVQAITSREVVNRLTAVPGAQSAAVAAFERRAEPALREWQCRPAVRIIENPGLPAVLLMDPQLLRQSSRDRAQPHASGKWSRLLNTISEASSSEDERYAARLVLNWSHPLVVQLAGMEDEVVFTRGIRLLHLQAVLGSGRPLNHHESQHLTHALSDLLALSLPSGQFPDRLPDF